MGKINKFANLYDKNGKLIRHTDKDGVLKNITIPELEKMIDEYPEDGDALALDNMKMALFQMYNKYGDPHREELIKRILEEQAKKTKPEEVTDKLQELNDYIEENKIVNLELEKPWTEDGTDEMVAELNKDSEGDKTDEFEYVDEIPVGNGIWDQMETKAREYDPEQHEANLNKYMQQIAAA